MILAKALLCAYVATVGFAQKAVKLRVGDIRTQRCPGLTEKDLIDENVKVSMSPLYRGSGSDSASLTVDGEGFNSTVISFPGCYLLTAKLRVKKPLFNPYAEVYLNMGGRVACRGPKPKTFKDEYCRNRTAPLAEFCPPSDNRQLRANSPDFSQSCRICNMCTHVTGAVNRKETDKYFSYLGGQLQDDCQWGDVTKEQTLTFRVCTPSPSELEKEAKKREVESLGEWDKYGEFLRGGNIIVSVHLAERPELAARVRPCDNACDRYEGFARTFAHRGAEFLERVGRSGLRTRCVPHDSYVGCFYSLIKFRTEGLMD